MCVKFYIRSVVFKSYRLNFIVIINIESFDKIFRFVEVFCQDYSNKVEYLCVDYEELCCIKCVCKKYRKCIQIDDIVEVVESL